jgi:hypothetical protein
MSVKTTWENALGKGAGAVKVCGVQVAVGVLEEQGRAQDVRDGRLVGEERHRGQHVVATFGLRRRHYFFSNLSSIN